MRKIIIGCAILLVAIIILAAKYFTALSGKDDNVTKVLNYLPADAALILSFKNDESFYEIFRDYDLFNAIIGESHQKEISSIKEVLLKPAKLNKSTFDKNIFLTLNPVRDSIEFLYAINLNKAYSSEDVREGIADIQGMTMESLSQDFYRLSHPKFDRPLYLFLQPGVALSSFSKELIARCVNEKTARLSPYLIEEINKTTSRNQSSPINLFINHTAVANLLQHFTSGKLSGNSSLVTDLKGFSSLSMNYKSDAMMFNGVSSIDSLTLNYLNLFIDQQGVPNQIKKVLPENTSNFIAFGFSDLKRFQKNLKTYFEKKDLLKDLELQLQSVKANSGIDPNRDIKPLLDKEFAVIENSYGEKFALIKLTNGRNLNFKLQLISNPLNELISQVNYSNVFYYYYGDPLKQFPRPYFAVADNYLVIANTPGIVRNYLSSYENDRFLSNTDAFRAYDQLVANKSNVLYFVNTKKSRTVSKNVLKRPYSDAVTSNRLQKFYGLSYQWTADGDHFFTNLYLSYNSSDSLTLNNE